MYRDLPYEVADDQSWNPLEFMPVGGECYVIAQTVLQEDEEGTERAVTAAVYRWTDAGVGANRGDSGLRRAHRDHGAWRCVFRL